MDKIYVNGLKLYAYHGVNPEEKTDGQLFIIDITAEVSLCIPCKTDSVNDTVSYSQIIKTAKRAFLSEKFDLLERAAQCIADSLLNDFEKIESVTVLLKKPEAPIKADFNYVAIEIMRDRGNDKF